MDLTTKVIYQSVLLIAVAFLSGCSAFGPYSRDRTYAAGEEPSYSIAEINTGDSPKCEPVEGSPSGSACKVIGKLVLIPPGASLSFQIIRQDGSVITCASPAEVAKTLSSAGSFNVSAPAVVGAQVATAASGGTGSSTENVILTQSVDPASHYIAAASFYNCLGYASGYIRSDEASANQTKIFENAIKIEKSSTKK